MYLGGFMNKETLITNLNQDLSNEFSAIIQYTTYSAKVTGPFRPELSKFFKAEVVDELRHAQYLADKIVALGGIPTTEAANVPDASDAKSMLEQVMHAESRAINDYKKRAEEAFELGFKALALELEDMVRDETNHKEEVEKILSGW